MRFYRPFSRTLIAAALIGSALLTPCQIQAQGYDFTRIADNSGSDAQGFYRFDSGSTPSINSLGVVTFDGISGVSRGQLVQGERGVFTGTGGAVNTVALASPSSGFYGYAGTSTNNSGTTAYLALSTTGQESLYLSNSSHTTLITTTAAGSPLSPAVSYQYGTPVINDAGDVLFFAQKEENFGVPVQPGDKGLYLVHNGVITTVADTKPGSPYSNLDGSYALNNAGEIAFGVQNGIVTLEGGHSPQTLLGAQTPSLNDKGTLLAKTARFQTGLGFYKLEQGVLSPVAVGSFSDPSNPLFAALDAGGINSSDDSVFEVYEKPYSERSLWVENDGILTRLIGPGDSLFGSTVVGVDLGLGTAINDNGQIAFAVGLSNGVSTIVRADVISAPVPEASTLITFGLLLALGIVSLVIKRSQIVGNLSRNNMVVLKDG